MVRLAAGIVSAGILLAACAGVDGPGGSSADDGGDLEARARALAERSIIVDTHVDLPYRLQEAWDDVTQTTDDGDFDYPRARQGGLNAPFMSIYTPARLQQTGGSRALADELIDSVERLERESPDKFAIARSVADVHRHFRDGLISLPMGMENGAPIGMDLELLGHFYDRGIRYVTLTHGKANQISDSSYDEERPWRGLSPFGREVVAEMNRLGMMVDISHVTDEAAMQVLEISKAPVIDSHSSCRVFTPGWERNMSDELIVALAEKGGVIHINFGSSFLTAAARAAAKARWDAVDAYRDEHGYEEDAEEVRAFHAAYRMEHPPVLATVSDVADHIDHVVDLVGVDFVGIGSDYDGVGPTTPIGLEDVSRYPGLIGELLGRGYSEVEIEKILGGNTLRVWSQVEQTARRLAAES